MSTATLESWSLSAPTNDQECTSKEVKYRLNPIAGHQMDYAAHSIDFQRRLASVRESRALLERRQRIRKEKAARVGFQFKLIVQQMRQAQDDAIMANERNRKLLRFDSLSQEQGKGKEKRPSTGSNLLPDRTRDLLEDNRSVKHPRSMSMTSHQEYARSPKRSSTCGTPGHRRHRNVLSIPSREGEQLEPHRSASTTPCEYKSSSDSSSESADITPRFGETCSLRANKHRPTIPRLDFSQTKATCSVDQKLLLSGMHNPHELETTSRRTWRNDSARLISLTDTSNHIGSCGDPETAKQVLPRIKRRAKMNGGIGSEVAVAGKGNDHEKKLVSEEGPSGLVNLRGCIAELGVRSEEGEAALVGQEVNPTAGRIQDSQAMTSNAEKERSGDWLPKELPQPTSTAGKTMTENKVTQTKESESIDLPDSISKEQERIQLSLWSPKEKLSVLKTLNNTMFLWEDSLMTYGSWNEETDLVFIGINAAKESQRKLFDSLDKLTGVPKRAICCRAVWELVRAYPPERLLPATYLTDPFVNEDMLKRGGHTAHLRESHDADATGFWEALVHHVVSLADHKMATPEETSRVFSEMLLPRYRKEELPGVGDKARLRLQEFLTRNFKSEQTDLRADTQGEKIVCQSNNDLIPNIARDCETERPALPAQRQENPYLRPESRVRNIAVTQGNLTVDNKQQTNAVVPKPVKKGFFPSCRFNSLKFWRKKGFRKKIDVEFVRPLSPSIHPKREQFNCVRL